ncbi:MAG: glycosyl transferase, partial [Prevotella sp.]
MGNHRHAYLIMAHNEWDLLNTLLSLIDDERNDIFLHIDKKVKHMPELYRPKHSGLYFTPERYDVRWGDVGQV